MSESSTSPQSGSLAYSSTPSSLLSLDNAASPTDVCPVCLCEADHAHFFGIKSCNSCAAFFRRSIVQQKSYKCKSNQNCVIKKDKHQRGCQSCRFKKCLKIGMLPDAVRAKASAPIAEDTGSLDFLLKCRRSNFTIRAQATLNTYGSGAKYMNMSNQLKTASSCKLALKAENTVLLQFIQRLGLTEDPTFAYELVVNFMPMWIASESLFSTVRHRGFQSKRAYYLDDSYLKYNEDFCVAYCRQYNCFEDPYLVARSGFKLYTAVVQNSEKIYRSRIGEAEFTAIQLVLLLQTAIRLQPHNNYFQQTLNQLFIALQKHMTANFESVPLRMDKFVENLERVQEVKRAQDEAFIMKYISSSKGDLDLQITPFIR